MPVVLAQPSGGPFSSATASKPTAGPEVVGTWAVLGQLEALAAVEPPAAAEVVPDAPELAADAELDAVADDEVDELLPQAATASPQARATRTRARRLRIDKERRGIGARG